MPADREEKNRAQATYGTSYLRRCHAVKVMAPCHEGSYRRTGVHWALYTSGEREKRGRLEICGEGSRG